jgi:hypothetical protein
MSTTPIDLYHLLTSSPLRHEVAAKLDSWLERAKCLLAKRRSAADGSEDPERQAAAVRALAYEHLKTDPGFAADLFAAADRHLENAPK